DHVGREGHDDLGSGVDVVGDGHPLLRQGPGVDTENVGDGGPAVGLDRASTDVDQAGGVVHAAVVGDTVALAEQRHEVADAALVVGICRAQAHGDFSVRVCGVVSVGCGDVEPTC